MYTIRNIFRHYNSKQMNFQGSMCPAGNFKNKTKNQSIRFFFPLHLPLKLLVLHTCQCVISGNVIQYLFWCICYFSEMGYSLEDVMKVPERGGFFKQALRQISFDSHKFFSSPRQPMLVRQAAKSLPQAMLFHLLRPAQVRKREEVHYLPVSVNRRCTSTSEQLFGPTWQLNGCSQAVVLVLFSILCQGIWSATSNLTEERKRRKGVSSADKSLQLFLQVKFHLKFINLPLLVQCAMGLVHRSIFSHCFSLTCCI